MNHFFDLGVKAAERPIQWWQRFHLSKQHNMVWTLKICEFVWDICLHLFNIIFDKTFAWFHQHTSNTACTWDFKLCLFYHFFFHLFQVRSYHTEKYSWLKLQVTLLSSQPLEESSIIWKLTFGFEFWKQTSFTFMTKEVRYVMTRLQSKQCKQFHSQ